MPRIALPDLAMVGIVVFLLLIIDRHSLWWDEATTLRLTQLPFGALVQLLVETTGSETSQPLYYLVIWPLAAVFGTSEAALRLPSLVFVVLAALTIRTTVADLTANGRAARWTAPLFLLLPVVLWYALEARPYGLIMLLAATHVWCSVRYVDGSDGSASYLGPLTLLVALSYAVAGLAAVTVVAFLLGSSGERRRRFASLSLRKRLTVIAGSGLAASFVALTALKSQTASVPSGRQAVLTVLYNGYELVFGRSIAWSTWDLRSVDPRDLIGPTWDLVLVALIGILITLLVLRLAAEVLRGRLPSGLQPITAIWLGMAMAFLAYSLVSGFPVLARHLLFALPALFATLMLAALTHAPRSRSAMGVALILLGLLGAYGIALSDRYSKLDFRGVSELLHECAPVADELIIIGPEVGFRAYLPSETHAKVRFLGSDVSQADLAIEHSASQQIVVFEQAHYDPDGSLSDFYSVQNDVLTYQRPGFVVLIDPGLASCVSAES